MRPFFLKPVFYFAAVVAAAPCNKIYSQKAFTMKQLAAEAKKIGSAEKGIYMVRENGDTVPSTVKQTNKKSPIVCCGLKPTDIVEIKGKRYHEKWDDHYKAWLYYIRKGKMNFFFATYTAGSAPVFHNDVRTGRITSSDQVILNVDFYFQKKDSAVTHLYNIELFRAAISDNPGCLKKLNDVVPIGTGTNFKQAWVKKLWPIIDLYNQE